MIHLNNAQLERLCDVTHGELSPMTVRIALDMIGPKYLQFPNTPEACAEFLRDIPPDTHRNEVELANMAWEMLSRQDLAKADTIEKVRLVHEQAPDGEIKQRAWDHWASLSEQVIENAQTLEGVYVAYKDAPPKSLCRFSAIKKMAEIILKESA